MEQLMMITAGVFGALSVLLGAFGAHGLKKILDDDALQSFETGVKYLMYHALLLLVLVQYFQLDAAVEKFSLVSIGLGTALFSFSIFVLIWARHRGISLKKFALLTPLGGLLMLLGWSLAVYAFLVQ